MYLLVCSVSSSSKTGRGAPSYSNAERKEFRRSRLFKVTGRFERADILTVVFLGKWLG